MPPAKSTKARAFTLIELMTVIAVIVILAALLLPAFRTAMENGRTIKCASNLNQIGTAMLSFSQDHGNSFPESGAVIPWGATDSTTGQQSWMQQLGPYISGTNDPQASQGKSVFTCPSSYIISSASTPAKYYSYFNGAHAAIAAEAGTAQQGKFAAVRRTLITMPVEQILSGDVTDWPAAGVIDADKDDFSQCPFDVKSTIHNGSVNLLFADGHVASATWNPALSPPGYFDQTRMSTHYQGTKNPATGQYYTYLTP
jgi:prepilin-type processing-associated H-X9-DG protein/prepilin-type N-terminal cleavage/methylation domain-containing protein